jgi:hypothetical protein
MHHRIDAHPREKRLNVRQIRTGFRIRCCILAGEQETHDEEKIEEISHGRIPSRRS